LVPYFIIYHIFPNVYNKLDFVRFIDQINLFILILRVRPFSPGLKGNIITGTYFFVRKHIIFVRLSWRLWVSSIGYHLINYRLSIRATGLSVYRLGLIGLGTARSYDVKSGRVVYGSAELYTARSYDIRSVTNWLAIF
jgi:hypothetical protein